MTDFSARVAILLFTRSAGQEAVHKTFAGQGGRGTNAAIAAQLIARATATAQQAGVDFLCVDSAAQTGRNFGERLSSALTHGFALGYEQLIVIGNDCPQLSPALVREALHGLATANAVLGPATDGGVYLLGVNRAFFEAEAWAALPWQTAALGQALAGHLRQAGAALYLLRPLADVDNAHDLARLLPRLPAGALRTRLHRLLAALRPTAAIVRPIFRRRAPAAPLPQRGPPAY